MTGALQPIRAEANHFLGFLANASIEVPRLQRPFAWGDEQIEDFVRDLNQLVQRLGVDENHPTEHLLGTIVLIQPPTPGARAQVVDGQQRLTVVTLTLGLIQQEMIRLSEIVEKAGGPQAVEIVNQLEMEINAINALLWSPVFGEEPSLKFKPSPEILKTYTSLISGGNGEVNDEQRAPAKHIREIAAILNDSFICSETLYVGQESVSKMRHLGRLKKVILEKLLFVAVTTAANDTGYELFEVLNARGEPLQPIDLVKTWIMARLAGYGSAKEVLETEERIRLLSNDDTKKQHLYLQSYFKAKTAQDLGRKDTKENSRRVRKVLFHDPVLGPEFGLDEKTLPPRIISEVKLMSDWYEPYNKISQGLWPYSKFDGFGQSRLTHLIKTLKHDLPVPLLLQASQKVDADTFLSMVHTLEKTFFRYKTIVNGAPGKLDSIYNDHIRVLDSTGKLNISKFKSDMQHLLDNEASDEIFKIMIQQKLNYLVVGQPLIRYFLQMLDLYASNPKPEKRADPEAVHIEHIGPQRPKSGKKEIADEDIHRLGNLCLLSDVENIELKNHPFAVKLQKVNEWRVKGSFISSKLTRDFFDNHTSWDSTLLAYRENDLINKAIRAFRSDSGSI